MTSSQCFIPSRVGNISERQEATTSHTGDWPFRPSFGTLHINRRLYVILTAAETAQIGFVCASPGVTAYFIALVVACSNCEARTKVERSCVDGYLLLSLEWWVRWRDERVVRNWGGGMEVHFERSRKERLDVLE